jgi:hypothetical protein
MAKNKNENKQHEMNLKKNLNSNGYKVVYICRLKKYTLQSFLLYNFLYRSRVLHFLLLQQRTVLKNNCF